MSLKIHNKRCIFCRKKSDEQLHRSLFEYSYLSFVWSSCKCCEILYITFQINGEVSWLQISRTVSAAKSGQALDPQLGPLYAQYFRPSLSFLQLIPVAADISGWHNSFLSPRGGLHWKRIRSPRDRKVGENGDTQLVSILPQVLLAWYESGVGRTIGLWFSNFRQWVIKSLSVYDVVSVKNTKKSYVPQHFTSHSTTD